MNNNFVLKKLYDLCNINNFSTYRLSQESGVPLTTISSLPKYLADFPHFTGIPACSLVK